MFKKSININTLIKEEMQDVKSALVNFDGFLKAATVSTPDAQTLVALCKNVNNSEDNADLALRKMIDYLADASYLPATKKELIDIASECDRIANKCEHTANTVVIQKCRIPDVYAQDIADIIATTTEQFELLEKAIYLMFADFRTLAKDHSVLDEIRSKESVVDKIETKIYESIFSSSDELARQLQIARIIELICDISDIIENIADKLQIMLITRKA